MSPRSTAHTARRCCTAGRRPASSDRRSWSTSRAGSSGRGMACARKGTPPGAPRGPAPAADAGWEVLPAVPLDPHDQLALDEVLLDRLIAGARGPALRFWEWTRPALVLGSHQSVANEVDL